MDYSVTLGLSLPLSILFLLVDFLLLLEGDLFSLSWLFCSSVFFIAPSIELVKSWRRGRKRRDREKKRVKEREGKREREKKRVKEREGERERERKRGGGER